MSPFPIPGINKLTGDFGIVGAMRLHDDEAASKLNPRLYVRHNLQPILPSKVEVRLARNEPAFERSGQKNCEK